MPRPQSSLIAATVLAVMVGGLGAGTAHADAPSDLYVNVSAANCSDTGPGSQAVPFCQIQPAANAATAGDTVYITASTSAYQTYGPVTITSSGTAAAPITFTSSAAGATGQAFIVAGAAPAISLVGAQYIDLNGFHTESEAAGATVDGASSHLSFSRMKIVMEDGGTGVVTASGAHDIALADIAFEGDRATAVSAVGTTGLVLAGDTITTGCGTGVSLTNGSSGSIENTVVDAYSFYAQTCTPGVTPAEISVDASSAAAGVTADYNVVNPARNGVDYDWAGTPYSTSAAFNTGTGQGAHDLDQTDTVLYEYAYPAEHSPLINSANATAPGELATDIDGDPRTDDPLVPSTGTSPGAGPADYDRGAFQFQDPLAAGLTGMSEWNNIAPYKPTAQINTSNPWNDALTYSFDFGDGSAPTAPSTWSMATHDYTAASPAGGYTMTATVTAQNGTTRTMTTPVWVAKSRLGVTLTVSRSAAHPDTASVSYTSTSTWPDVTNTISFSDGTHQIITGGSGTFTHAYDTPGTYSITDDASNAGQSIETSVPVTVGTAFVPMNPVRILDTRNGTGAARAKVGPGGAIQLKVLGVKGIPATGVAAVTLNVTDADATAASYVTAYEDDNPRPTTSNLNFLAGQVNPNLVTVQVNPDGFVDLYNHAGSVDLIADVQGYYTTTTDSSPQQSGFVTAAPTRVLDTRNGTGARKGAVGPKHTVVFKLPSQPANATAATLSITETGATANGYVSAYCGTAATPPTTSSVLNYTRGQTTSNLADLPVCDGGYVSLYNSAGDVSLIADLQGYYSTSTGDPFVPVTPRRFLDTRSTNSGGPYLHANETRNVKTWLTQGTSALLNITGTGSSANTWLSAFGSGSVPTTSNLDLTPGETRPVLAVVPFVGKSSTYFHLYNKAGDVNVLADLDGYFG